MHVCLKPCTNMYKQLQYSILYMYSMCLQLTNLIPELDVLDAYGQQLILIERVPLYHEEFVLVGPSSSQLLSFLPVPHNNTVIIIQTNRGQLLTITCKREGERGGEREGERERERERKRERERSRKRGQEEESNEKKKRGNM